MGRGGGFDGDGTEHDTISKRRFVRGRERRISPGRKTPEKERRQITVLIQQTRLKLKPDQPSPGGEG